MRFSRFCAALALVAMSCAQQQQNDDDELVPDDEPSDGGSISGAGKASAGSSKGGSSSTAGRASDMAGRQGGGTAGTEGNGDEAGEGGSAPQGGKPGGGGGSGGKAGSAGGGGKAGSAGTGGKAGGGGAGAGGSAGMGGSGGAGCKPSTGGPVAGLSARYESEIDNASGTSIGAQLSIYNASQNTFNLADLKLRYYITNEVTAAVTRGINWAWLRPISGGGQTDLKSKVNFNVVDMTCKTAKADAYLEFTFGADAGLLEADHYVLLSWAATNAATQNFDQSNDFSFSAGQVIGSDYANVVVLQNSGTKLWGTEP